jgi:hypothetical protein
LEKGESGGFKIRKENPPSPSFTKGGNEKVFAISSGYTLP